MNDLSKALTQMKRRPVKSGIFVILLFILGTVLSGAISIRQGIRNTESSLIRRLPAVSALFMNVQQASLDLGVPTWEVDDAYWQVRPKVEDIHTVGNLGYVRNFDTFISTQLMSADLDWAFPNLNEDRLPSGMTLTDVEDFGSLVRWGGQVESFEVRGVANPELTDISAGLIELVAGRTFTPEELESGERVLMISQLFAETNQLAVGSIVELDNMVFDYVEFQVQGITSFLEHWHDPAFQLLHEVLAFEVIGIFEVVREFGYEIHDHPDAPWVFESALWDEVRLHNRFYLPIGVAEEIVMFGFEERITMEQTLREELGLNYFYTALPEPQIEAIFVLDDSRDLKAFQQKANDLLPGFWQVTDLRDVDATVLGSMDSMLDLADIILFTTAGATVLILTLLMTLLVHDRREEIGIFLALGEKRHHIIRQFLLEMFLMGMLAIANALFAGNVIAQGISEMLLERQVQAAIQQQPPFPTLAIPWELILFNPGELPLADLLELYDTALTGEMVLLYLGVSALVLVISTLMPLIQLVRLQPRNLLL